MFGWLFSDPVDDAPSPEERFQAVMRRLDEIEAKLDGLARAVAGEGDTTDCRSSFTNTGSDDDDLELFSKIHPAAGGRGCGSPSLDRAGGP